MNSLVLQQWLPKSKLDFVMLFCPQLASGAVYKFNNARGQGGFLNWNLLPW